VKVLQEEKEKEGTQRSKGRKSMSGGVEKEHEEDKRVLRRSKRTRKPRTLIERSNSETDLIGSETETVVGWKFGNEIVGEESDRGSEYSYGTFSETAYKDYTFEDEREKREKRPKAVSDEIARVENSSEEKRMSKKSNDSGRGRTPESGLGEFFKFYMEDQKRRDEESRRTLDTQQRMLEAMMTRTDVRETAPAPTIRLPSLKEGEEVETFIVGFETALRLGEVPRELWKRELATFIPMGVLSKVSDVVNKDGSSYNDIVGALRGSVSLSFGSTAENLCTGERGRVYEMDVRPSLSRLKHLIKAVAASE